MTWREHWLSVRQWVRAHQSTLRLAASYLVVIMVMSLGFSYIFYHTSSHELGRQLPPDRLLPPATIDSDNYRDFFLERIQEGRSHLLNRLVILNVLTLVLGSILSYVLARLTLEPIEGAMEAQARFASDASHELRTPLATIQTENEVALRNPKLTLTHAKDLLRSNLEEVVRLRELAESLLRLSRGHENELNIMPVALDQVATEAVDSFQKAAEQKKITIETDLEPALVLADSASVLQIVKILLDNAIKYSDEGAKVRVTATRDHGSGFLSVQDEGAGISAQDMPHIFERFFRADLSRSKQHVEGNGLGLALASTLIQQLDGEITVVSTLGQGTTFTVRLPRAR